MQSLASYMLLVNDRPASRLCWASTPSYTQAHSRVPVLCMHVHVTMYPLCLHSAIAKLAIAALCSHNCARRRKATASHN